MIKYDIFYYEKYDDIDRIRKRVKFSSTNLSERKCAEILSKYKKIAIDDAHFSSIVYRCISEKFLTKEDL